MTGLSLGLWCNRRRGGTPTPTAPNAFTSGQWTFARSGTSGELAVGIISTPSGTTNIKYRLDGGSWVSRGNTLSFNLTGLTNGTEYDLELIASNITGDSAASDLKSATPATVPSAIVLTATPGDGQITLTHSAPAANGSAITDYVYEYKLDSEPTTWTTWSDGTSTTPGAVITGLTNDVAYDTRAFAINAVGTSAASNIETDTPSAVVSVVTLAPNDTLSRLEITNTASFPGATWAWYDDGGSQIGTVATDYLLNSAVPAGEFAKARANGNAATDSNLWTVQQNVSVWNESFASITNGTDLSGHASWVGPTNKFKFNSGKLRCEAELGYPNLWFTRDMPEANYGIEGTFDFNASGGGNAADESRIKYLYLNYTDESNWIALVVQGNGCQFQKRVAGTVTDLIAFLPTNNAGSQAFKFETQVIGGVNYVRGFRNGIRLDPAGPGLAATGLTITARVAMRFGSGLDASNPSYPYSVASAIHLRATPDLGLAVYDVSFTIPDDANPPAILFNGATDYADIQAVVVSDDGQERGGFTSFTGLTPGAISLSSPNPPEAMGAGAFLRLRQTSNPANYTDYSMGDLPVYDQIPAFKVGTQSGGALSYSNSDLFRDRARQGMWIWRGGALNNLECTLNDDGYPIGPMPSGATGVALKLWEGGLQKEGVRAGPFRAEITNGTASAITPYGLSNITTSGATSTGVTLTLNMVASPPDDYFQAYIEFTVASLPADGFKVTCVPVGDGSTSADIVCPQTAAIWDGFPWRDMKESGAENAGPNTKTKFGGKVEFAIHYVNKTSTPFYYHNLIYSDVAHRPETTARPWLESFRDNLLTTTCVCEVSNESFNDFYQNQFYWHAAEAAQVPGCWPDGLIPAGKVLTNEAYNPENNLAGRVYRYTEDGLFVSGELLAPITAGSWFIATGAGYQSVLVECLANAPAGVVIPSSGEDSYFRIHALYADIKRAGRLYVANLQAQAGILGKSIMGARFKSVLGIWLLDDVDTVCDLLEFNDAYLNIDHFSPSFYSGGRVAYSSLPWAASTGATFKTGYYALRRATCDAMIADLVRLKHGVVEEMVRRGHAIADIPTMDYLYEGLSHDVITNIPSDQLDRVKAEIAACHNSAEEGTETGYMLTQGKTKVGGAFMTFADVALLFYNNDQLQQWGLRYHQLDGAYNSSGAGEVRYLAAKAV